MLATLLLAVRFSFSKFQSVLPFLTFFEAQEFHSTCDFNLIKISAATQQAGNFINSWDSLDELMLLTLVLY